MARMLELLGTFRITLNVGATRRIESDKGRALLAYLALEADRPHARTTLAAILWPDVPEAVARHNLSQALFNLRQVLGKQPHTSPVILVERMTLQWNAGNDLWVDVHEVVALRDACARHDHLDAVTCEPCAERRERIVALHRGLLLEGLEVRDSDVWEDWLSHKRRWYVQVALEQIDLLIACFARRRAFHRARQYALRGVELDPWREESHRQLIALADEAGDRPAALTHYEHWRTFLDTELGVEPAPETQALYERVLKERVDEAPPPAVSRLPIAGPCIGRTTELGAIERLLQGKTRLLTITGPGGTGKTRLALEVARRHGGSVGFVALAPLNTSAEVIRAIADTVNCMLNPAEDPWDQTLRCLATGTTLLILDNFEHLTDAASMINDILQHAPDVTLVVTSRERLGLRAETVFALGGLLTPAEDEESDSVQLFITAAQQTRSTWTPRGEERGCIARICRTLGGLPLAIELAAGWIGVLSPAEIEQELGRDLDILRSSLRDVPTAHQSMRQVFERSWMLLAEPERQLLRQLSVFRDGFDRDAAVAVAHEDGSNIAAPAVLDRLQALINASLCRPVADDQQTTRYNFHPLVEHFAAEHLVSSDEQQITQRRHAEYFLKFVERAHAPMTESHADASFADLDREHANLRVALAWAADVEPHTLALRFIRALASFWYARGYWDEARSWYIRVLQVEHPDSADLADAFLAAGSLATLQGDTMRARTWLERSRQLYQQFGHQYGYAKSLNQLGSLAEFVGDDDTAVALHQASIAELRALNDLQRLSAALGDLGDVVRRQGGDATALYEESYMLARRSGDPRSLARSLYDLAVLLRERNELERAVLLLEESVALTQTLGDRLALLGSLTQLGETVRQRGDLDRALSLQETSVREARTLGSAWSIAWALLNLGRVLESMGDQARARALFEEALTLAEAAGDRLRIQEIRDTLGRTNDKFRNDHFPAAT